MTINLNVKIKAGPRTPVEVEVCGTAVNEKKIKFANGEEVTGSQIADFLKKRLTNSLKELAGE